MPAVRSKRYRQSSEGLDPHATLSVDEAVKAVKERANTKFDETVDLAVKLNIDTKQSDQLVRGSFALPHGTGKQVRVIAFCEGDEVEAAKANGAVEAGGEELAEKIQQGWMDFDVALAHPKMMRFVGKLGKTLGPKGLMPSPKSGTVTDNVSQAVKEFVAGKIEFRNDKEGNIHMPVGKAGFEEPQLCENVRAAIQHLLSIRPSAVKGEYVKKIRLSSTMGPSFRVALP